MMIIALNLNMIFKRFITCHDLLLAKL